MRKSDNTTAYYIEDLFAHVWLCFVLPYFLKDGRRALRGVEHICYFNRSWPGYILAHVTLWPFRVKLERVLISQAEARDHKGALICMRTTTETRSIQTAFGDNPEVRKVVDRYKNFRRLEMFLNWRMICSGVVSGNSSSMLHLVYLVEGVACREGLDDPAESRGREVRFFVRDRPGFVELKQYAGRKKVGIIPTGALYFYVNTFLSSFDGLKSVVKRLMYAGMVIGYKMRSAGPSKRPQGTGGGERLSGPRLLVEYYGQLNLDSPGMYSDLFFLNGSPLLPRDVLVYFGLPRDPVTDRKLEEIERHGLSAIAINHRATVTPGIPVFKRDRRPPGHRQSAGAFRDQETTFFQKWLGRNVEDYHRLYDYWLDFITRYDVKIHVTWPKHDTTYFALLDALQNTGGVGISYQRSFQHGKTLWTSMMSDVVFGISPWGAPTDDQKYAVPSYYVVVGYMGDYRFGLLRKQADDVRRSLQHRGAKKIMAYFDEKAKDDSVWNLEYKVSMEQYSFLLKKVLDNPWFGLILKPKVPASLRSRLGSVSELLRAAEATGRCFVFEEGVLHGSHPPAIASLAADVAVHGHFFAATAGIEAALAGTPTLFLDYEGVPESPLHRLGRHVIYENIDSLWKACADHWSHPGGIPGFGDWSDVLDGIDPFRDGRAAERIGTYMNWLMDGFKAGLPRETVMADAARRYADTWGKDKVTTVDRDGIKREFDQACLSQTGSL